MSYLLFSLMASPLVPPSRVPAPLYVPTKCAFQKHSCITAGTLLIFVSYSACLLTLLFWTGQNSVYNDLHSYKRASSSSSKKHLLVSLLSVRVLELPQAWRKCKLTCVGLQWLFIIDKFLSSQTSCDCVGRHYFEYI